MSELENFSNLKAGLKGVETGLTGVDLKELRQTRNALVNEIETSRYRLGERLAAYKEHFGKSRLWMKAVEVIAESLEVNERTVRNVLSDYLNVADLPQPVREAAKRKGIDVAKQKNRAVVDQIKRVIEDQPDVDEAGADEIVSNVLFMQPVKGSSEDDGFEPLTREEKNRYEIRRAIRRAMVNIAPVKRLKELIAALEEEMYSEWGVTKPETITVTPRKSTLTSDGRKRKTVAA